VTTQRSAPARKEYLMLLKTTRTGLTGLVAGCLFTCATGFAADTSTAQPYAAATTDRPRIGLVLAGGGAKGGAHVGVLKVLEEMRVPVDCIAGTSMGALVGAGYASGIPANALQEFLVEIDWKSVVGGLGQRDLQPIEQKRAGVTYSNNLELGLKDKRVVVPGGIVNTAGIEDLLRTYVARARMQSSFDRLPIPFRAVATDMITGEMVVLDKGDLATAMRASMAIPGAFAPVVTDEYILADGGMVRNIPVDVARELCADVVIVVNLVEPSARREKLQSATQLLSRSTDVMLQANETLQLRTLTERDVRIDVIMGDIGTADFERVPETIPLGEAAARAAADRLAHLAVPEPEYLAWRQKVTASQDIEARLAGVRYEGLERVNPAYLEQQAQVRAGDMVDTAKISAEAQRMSALQEFESVEYRLTGDPANPTLVWLPREKRVGPDYLKFDLGMYVSEGGDIAFAIYAKHNRTWLNSRGGEWRNEVQLGSENLLATSLYQPLDVAQKFFVEPRLLWSRNWEYVFLDGERLARYRLSDLGGSFDTGINLGNRTQMRVGYLYTRRDVEVNTGSPLMPEVERDDAGLTASLTFDSRDTPFNATHGGAAALEYFRSDDSLGADSDWERIELGLGLAVPVRNDVIWMTLAGGSNLDSDLPADRTFRIGGPGSFPGFELGELRSDEYWTASGSYLWKIKDILSIRGQALYAGLRLQVGQTYERLDQIDEDTMYGGSVYVTGRTMVGPLTVGVGATSTDSYSVWLAIGRPIGHGTILERGIFR
jgi:NTE family protein